MKIAIITLGCRVNQAESNKIGINLQRFGHKLVDNKDNPDICIINTCSVTSKSDCQSLQLISKITKTIPQVIVTGCYSELNKLKISDIHPNIRIVPNANKLDIIDLIGNNKIDLVDISKKNRAIRYRPIIKVQDGCNNLCSYCIVPFARGKSRSILPKDIISEIKYYEESGYNEIVLSGIHLGSYGVDLEPKTTLEELIKNILINNKIHRIRLSSLEITEITDKLIELLQDNRICKHLHIPLQSGDDKILQLMNRRYIAKDYILTISKLFHKFSDITIGSDIIVGFPSEGQREFENTKNLIKEYPFSYIHIFRFSKRINTKAFCLDDQISDTIKKQRYNELKDIGYLKKQDFLQRNLNKTIEIIVEGTYKDCIIGTSGNYIKALFKSDIPINLGGIANIKVTGIKNHMAQGIPINELYLINK